MFHTGIDPELLKVKLSMIDLCKDCITIDKSISKIKPLAYKSISKK
jgi:hypothetical protein